MPSRRRRASDSRAPLGKLRAWGRAGPLRRPQGRGAGQSRPRVATLAGPSACTVWLRQCTVRLFGRRGPR
eukprot:5633091-Lingulodinium_polyedra.AAC.1